MKMTKAVVLGLLMLSGSALAATHNIKYESRAEGDGSGRYYINYTDPTSGKEQSTSAFGSYDKAFDNVTLKAGQKLTLDRWLYAGRGSLNNICQIYVDGVLVAENNSSHNSCTVSYVFK